MTLDAPSLEVAVYTVKDAEQFGELQQQAHKDLATFDGFIDGVALRSLNTHSYLADLILWQSDDTAKRAAEKIQQDERFAAFLQGIESVNHFGHYSDASFETLNQLAERPVIEIAAYKAPSNIDNIGELRSQIQTALHDVEGAYPGIAGIHTSSPLSLVDVIGWRDRAVHQAAPGILIERHPELEPFFSSISNMDVFQLFEVV